MHESKLFNNKREKERQRGLKGKKSCVSNKEVFISIQNCCCRDKQDFGLDIMNTAFPDLKHLQLRTYLNFAYN